MNPEIQEVLLAEIQKDKNWPINLLLMKTSWRVRRITKAMFTALLLSSETAFESILTLLSKSLPLAIENEETSEEYFALFRVFTSSERIDHELKRN